jgi:hypothetical protein
MANDKPIPYSSDVREQDTLKARETVGASLFPDEHSPVAIDFKGACPRCGHATACRAWLVAVSGALRLTADDALKVASYVASLRRAPSTGDQTFDISCACNVEHPKHPPDTSGCGAKFRLRVAWP